MCFVVGALMSFFITVYLFFLLHVLHSGHAPLVSVVSAFDCLHVWMICVTLFDVIILLQLVLFGDM